ncbi:hypothetical protein [Chryseobacterium sp. SIMBA_038]|uniref:hypothetical protein n=1 Tax=Chryseobacterium sp. SIMBA_038 TaxID=3085780 RepID=UPI003977F2B0
MKKTILAGMLLATFSTSMMSANTVKFAEPEEANFFCYKISYVTEKEGSCTVTYKVTTKYFLCCPLSSTKAVYSKSCPTTPSNPTGGTGGQN